MVQSNFPHARGGAKLVTFDQQEAFHFSRTRDALAIEKPDLVAWSETVLPPMNLEARRRTRDARFWEERASVADPDIVRGVKAPAADPDGMEG